MDLQTFSRRRFIQRTPLATLTLSAFPEVGLPAEAPATRFFLNLSCGRIGAKATFLESVELAVKYGFQGVDPDPRYFAGLTDDQLSRLLESLQAKNINLGAAGLPVDFRRDEETFAAGLKSLPEYCKTLQRTNVQRVGTWILSFSDNLTYLENFRLHQRRLKACVEILKDHRLRLGLEYVAPKTSWRSSRHPFIHCMSEMKELVAAIGTSNAGFQLDSWHWFNAEETQADLLSLRGQEVVLVDLNDAPAGVPLDRQKDLSRELPCATGVIPVKAFLDGLRKIGYDGPVQAEPFSATLQALPRDEAVAKTAQAMKKAFSL